MKITDDGLVFDRIFDANLRYSRKEIASIIYEHHKELWRSVGLCHNAVCNKIARDRIKPIAYIGKHKAMLYDGNTCQVLIYQSLIKHSKVKIDPNTLTNSEDVSIESAPAPTDDVPPTTQDYRCIILSKVLNKPQDEIVSEALLHYLRYHLADCRKWAHPAVHDITASSEDKEIAFEFIQRDWLTLLQQQKEASLEAYD